MREKEWDETEGLGVGERKRKKRGGLTDVSGHLQTPRHYGTFPWVSREGRTGTRPYQNQNLSSLPRGGDQSPILSLS